EHAPMGAGAATEQEPVHLHDQSRSAQRHRWDVSVPVAAGKNLSVIWLAQEVIFRANPTGDAVLLPSPAYAFRLALDDYYCTRPGPMQFLVSLTNEPVTRPLQGPYSPLTACMFC